jgi:rod shape-determining protein MreD
MARCGSWPGPRVYSAGSDVARGEFALGGRAVGPEPRADRLSGVSLPLAAVGAVLAALLEASVLSELTVAGAKFDLVLVMAIVAALMVGVEEGLVWAFLGGLMLDLILPDRPLGATVLSLLVVTGLAIAATRVAGQNRRLVAVLLVASLTSIYHAVTIGVLAATSGLDASKVSMGTFVVAAVLNTVLAFVLATIVRSLLLRFSPSDSRADWLSA